SESMPAFSHFFLKRFSARSKFSSSWIMTSDKICFPPSWRRWSPACVQTVKLRRRERMGQAKPLLFGLVTHRRVTREELHLRRCVGGGSSSGALACCSPCGFAAPRRLAAALAPAAPSEDPPPTSLQDLRETRSTSPPRA